MQSDPISLYRNLKIKIPLLKERLRNYLNEFHDLDESSDFWWVLGGEYALYAEYLSMLSLSDNRFLYEIQAHQGTRVKIKDISAIIVNLIGRDAICGLRAGVSENILASSNCENLGFADESKHFSTSLPSAPEYLVVPYDRIANLFQKLFNIKHQMEKLIPFKFRRAKAHNYNDNNFEFILAQILPQELLSQFPRWFLIVAKIMITERDKWRTHFGLELNIFHYIMLAVSYDRFGDKNIYILSHGSVSGAVNFWHLFRFSVCPRTVLSVRNQSLLEMRASQSRLNLGVLYCPPQFPWVAGFLSVGQWQKLLKAHALTINLLRNASDNGMSVKVRYKDFRYLSGYSGPFLSHENSLPRETSNFEDVYEKYGLIISLGYGTILAKCLENNINSIAYHLPTGPYDIHTDNYIRSLPGIYSDLDAYISELQVRIEMLSKA